MLIVYEGYQIEEFTTHRHATSLRVEEESNDLSFMENTPGGSDTCYDADTSNNSTDYNLLAHEEVSQAALHRGFGEAAARGAKNTTAFYPVNEETVFMDPPPSLINTVVQSPSYDNWMLYSSSSGEDYCFGQHIAANSEDTSSDIDIRSECALKRNRHKHRLRSYDDVEQDQDELKPSGISKRFRVKTEQTTTSVQDAMVDVRIIDFAHTTFGRSSLALACNSSSMIHQGPDCGFLTGLDSLKRLLMEILTEG